MSTYCQHASHLDCRRRCKTCRARCLCPCHRRQSCLLVLTAAVLAARLLARWHRNGKDGDMPSREILQ